MARNFILHHTLSFFSSSVLGGQGIAPQRHLYTTQTFQARRRGCVQTKTFRKDSEASSRAERWRGYVILFSNEPSCCYVATSERRRIRLKADFHYFALRGASIRRSRRSNNSATPYTFFTTFVATPLSTYLSCVVTARRFAFAVGQYLDCQARLLPPTYNAFRLRTCLKAKKAAITIATATKCIV